MPFPEAIRTCFNKYVDFTGRARRSEFWFWVLFTFLVGIVASIIDSVLGTRSSTGTGLVGGLADLALLLPTLAVAARRLHDTGRSAWWLLLYFLCVIGWIILIVWYCLDSQGDNKYGPSPKGAGPGGYPGGYEGGGYAGGGYGGPPPPGGPDYGSAPPPPPPSGGPDYGAPPPSGPDYGTPPPPGNNP
jgi:uncharacterized membrane protein YhaH (DUF805 family)